MESPPLLSSVELAEYLDRGIVVLAVPSTVQKLQQQFLSQTVALEPFFGSCTQALQTFPFTPTQSTFSSSPYLTE